jgi:hypothetical protein
MLAAEWNVPKTAHKEDIDSGVSRVVDFTTLQFNPAIIMVISSPEKSEHLYLTFAQSTKACVLSVLTKILTLDVTLLRQIQFLV